MSAQKSAACRRFEVVFCQQLAHFGKRVVIRSAAVGDKCHRRCTLTVQAASKVRRNLVRQPTGIHRTAEYDQLIRGKLILLRTVRRRVERYVPTRCLKQTRQFIHRCFNNGLCASCRTEIHTRNFFDIHILFALRLTIIPQFQYGIR